MKVLLNAFREAVRGRNMVKAKALNKVEKFCQKRGLNVGDTFEQAVKNVKHWQKDKFSVR